MSHISPAELVERALRAGYVTPTQVAECERTREELENQGRKVSLPEILIEKRYITSAHIKALTEELPLPVLEECELEKELGAGYMGTAYLVQYTVSGRKLVFKVMHKALSEDDAFASRSIDQARLCAFIEHGGFPRVYGAEKKAGDLFFVSEYAEGTMLAEFLSHNEKCSVKGALELILSVVKTLHYLYSYGLTHKNISPKNILLTKEGRALLLDVGLEKAKPSDFSLLHPGKLVLSPLYLSPEHLDWELDVRSDIFSLGTVFYEMLTGIHPFAGDTTAEVIDNIKTRTPVEPSELVPTVSPNLSAVVMKMLEKEPPSRYQDHDELLIDLETVKSGGVPSPRKFGTVEVVTRRVKRKSRKGLVLAVVGAVVALSIGVGLALRVRQERTRIAELPTIAGTTSTTTTPKLSPHKDTDTGEKAITEALEFARESKDRSAIIARFKEIVEKYPDTPWALQAELELDKLEQQEERLYRSVLEQTKRRVDELIRKLRFGEALKQYDRLAERFPKKAEEDRKREELYIEGKADEAYGEIEQRAKRKVSAGLYSDAISLYRQVVENFGLENYVRRAEAEIRLLEPLSKKALELRRASIDRSKYDAFLASASPVLKALGSFDIEGALKESHSLLEGMKGSGLEPFAEEIVADIELIQKFKRRALERLNEKKPRAELLTNGQLKGKLDSVSDSELIIKWGPATITKKWNEFKPREILNLLLYAIDHKSAEDRVALGILSLYYGEIARAEQHFKLARALGVDTTAFEERVAFLEKERPQSSKEGEASELLLEAQRFLKLREYDRALYRLAILRDKYAPKDYAIREKLDEIEDLIALCLQEVRKEEFALFLSKGRTVRLIGLDGWKETRGRWELKDGRLIGKNEEQIDAEYLFTATHPAHYELSATMKVLEGRGGLLRIVSNGKNHYDFWLDVENPKNVGLYYATGKERPERVLRPFTFKRNEGYRIRALVSPQKVIVFFADNKLITPNKVKLSNSVAYGFVVNGLSTVEFSDATVRVMRKQ